MADELYTNDAADDGQEFLDEIRKIGRGRGGQSNAPDALAGFRQKMAVRRADDVAPAEVEADRAVENDGENNGESRDESSEGDHAGTNGNVVKDDADGERAAPAPNGPPARAKLPAPLDLNDEKNLEADELEDKRLVARMAKRRAMLAKTEAARQALPSSGAISNDIRAARSELSTVSVTLQEVITELNTVREEIGAAKSNSAKVRTGQQPFGCPPVPASVSAELQKCFEFLEKRLGATAGTVDHLLEKLGRMDRAFMLGRRGYDSVVDALQRHVALADDTDLTQHD